MTDIGYIIGTIVMCVFLLVALGLGLLGITARLSGDYAWPWFATAAGTVLVAVGLWVWGAFPPFDMEYHQWRPVSGTVEQIDARLIASGDKGGSTQNFVVVINGREYRCDDSRCATVKAGDALSLRCQRVWEYASTSGYVCRFVDVERAAR